MLHVADGMWIVCMDLLLVDPRILHGVLLRNTTDGHPPHSVASASGVAGLLYVTTGVHGGHVLLGMVLILLYDIQSMGWGLYVPVSTDSIHGILSIVLY